MIKINKITTKTGDKGKTLGPGMRMLDKFDCNIEFLGNLDELNCALGFCGISRPSILSIPILNIKRKKLNTLFEELQNQIFDIGAIFFKNHTQESHTNELEKFIKFIEEKIEYYNKNLPTLNSFLLPSGNVFVLRLHLARVVTRRAERNFWQYIHEEFNNNSQSKRAQKEDMEKIGIYLNRLSDLMFAVIRNYSTKTWVPFIIRNKKS